MKLTDWMAAHNVDDEAFSNSVGADRTTINRIRRGVTMPSWDLASRIAAATEGQVSANDFLSAEPQQVAS